MQRKRTKRVRPLPEHWQREHHLRVHGRHVYPGTELRITGQRGRFRFESVTRTPRAVWVDVRDKDGRWRSFSVQQIRTVHVYKRLRRSAKR